MADLGGEALQARAGQGDRLQQLGVPVTGDDLGGDVLAREAQGLEDPRLELGPQRRVGADRAAQRPDTRLGEGPFEPLCVAVRLEREAGELEPERRRLGMDAVSAANRDDVFVGKSLAPHDLDQIRERVIHC